MRLHAADNNADDWRVFDKDTGKEIGGVEWADDETGEYRQARMDADGRFIVETHPDGDCDLVFEMKRGNIEFRRPLGKYARSAH